MWFQAALCMMVAVAAAIPPHAVSHQARVDNIHGHGIHHGPHDDHHGHGVHGSHHHQPHHRPSYRYSYSVDDRHTGDHKDVHEAREGDHVRGSYSLVEPDGNVRSVHYVADSKDGFRAAVRHSTVHHHIPRHHHGHHHGHHDHDARVHGPAHHISHHGLRGLGHHDHGHVQHISHHGHVQHISHHGHIGHHGLGLH